MEQKVSTLADTFKKLSDYYSDKFGQVKNKKYQLV